MAADRLYLDHNATAPLRPEAAAAMRAALERVGNPSSVHAEGRAARAAVEAAREAVAALVGARPAAVTFTSGATEALNLALTPDLVLDDRPFHAARLLASAVEHLAVLDGHRFPSAAAERLPVDGDGRLDIAALEATLAAGPGPVLLALQSANNETGVIQPAAEAAARVHAAGGAVVVDAVQSAGRVPTDLAALGADFLVVSGHKLGAPAGVGALIRRSEGVRPAGAMIRGGGQERGGRSGTENLLGIVGFGAAAAAARAALAEEEPRLRTLRSRLEEGLRTVDPATVIFSAGADRLPNTTAFAVPGIKAETALIALDLDGLAVSSGSACSSGKVKASHVLDAMAIGPDLLHGMIRMSVGWSSTLAEVEQALAIWARVHARLKERAAA
ncbi:MAG TPA: aminotransferase class V-fold PLP-dependent enzyme [Hyphomicrobiales bacterium]|nr:aminotransferase class V-fold PLP-dependent enzyme [Hyphomicrobiales bacterium]